MEYRLCTMVERHGFTRWYCIGFAQLWCISSAQRLSVQTLVCIVECVGATQHWNVYATPTFGIHRLHLTVAYRLCTMVKCTGDSQG